MLLVFVFTAFQTQVLAQKKELKPKDAIALSGSLYPQYLYNAKWKPNSTQFTYVDTRNYTELVQVDVKQKSSEVILKNTELGNWLKEAKIPETFIMPECNWTTETEFWFYNKNYIVEVDLKAKKVKNSIKFNEKGENQDIASNLNVAYTVENNLFINANNQEIQVTNDKDKNFQNGKTVARSEFGIHKGTYWSPSGNLLAFYHEDQSKVTDYPYVDYTTKPASSKPAKYEMAGMDNGIVKVGVFDVKTKKIIWLKTGAPDDQYHTNVTWSPDEKFIYIAHVNRDQNHMKLAKYDVATGNQVGVLFEEKDKEYVQPMNGLFFVNDNPNKFLWLSRRDGYNHFYLYENGKLAHQVEKGNWEVIDFKGFDEKGEYVYCIGNSQSPIGRQFLKINIAKGKIAGTTSKTGTHDAILSPDSKYFVDSYSSFDIPNEVGAFETKKFTEVYHFFTAKNKLEDYEIGKITQIELKANDGTKLFGRLILPPNLDKNKKHPVLIYVYGGPHSQMVQNHWESYGNTLWLQAMAAKGYVVLTVDNRGTDYRGEDFEQATFKKLSEVEIQDQLVGIEYLKKQSYVDADKIGVFGWSYGGFMTTSLMLKASDVFKVGVAGAPVIDWKYYEVVYTERYMDKPQDNEEGYKYSNTINHIDQLKGKLMLIHGTSDNIVMWQHTINFLDAAINKGKQVDYFVYPGHLHGVRGKARIHLYEKITNYFDQYLK